MSYVHTCDDVYFQGYDVTSVLQQELGPLTCIIVSATKHTDSCHFVVQELMTK